MADITMCKGVNCPKEQKQTCFRFLAPENEYRQSYFIESPINTHTNICQQYWKIEKK